MDDTSHNFGYSWNRDSFNYVSLGKPLDSPLALGIYHPFIGPPDVRHAAIVDLPFSLSVLDMESGYWPNVAPS